MSIYPQKLQVGDEIRIIAPAKSFKSSFSEEKKLLAIERLQSLGLKISFGKYVYEVDEFESTTVEHRLEDLHEAFADKKVKGILTVLGGTASNQLLKYLDYNLIKNNPKILCGLSDITALANGIYSQTGLVTYSGPHFTLFGADKSVEYTLEYFKKCFLSEEPFEVEVSKKYCNGRWDEIEIENDGLWIINEGKAEGKILGGNLITFNLLQGTNFKPSLLKTILFLEDNEKESFRAFENHLQSIINQTDFSGVQAILIGRFQAGSKMSKDLLTKIIKTKKELEKIPVIANLDFGHTTPMFTFPIGGEVGVDTDNKTPIEIIKH